MFTGLVSDIGRVVASVGSDALRKVRIDCSYDPGAIPIGASIACGGPCLTVTAREATERGAWFAVDVAAETLAVTTARSWAEGTRLNLERSLRIGDELGGHIVTGHVDGVATIVGREDVTAGSWGPSRRFRLKAPKELSRFIAQKGSVSLDGVSLTVNDVDDDTFSVLIIPHTLAVTTWGERAVGNAVNLEVDLMARYAARLSGGTGSKGG